MWKKKSSFGKNLNDWHGRLLKLCSYWAKLKNGDNNQPGDHKFDIHITSKCRLNFLTKYLSVAINK